MSAPGFTAETTVYRSHRHYTGAFSTQAPGNSANPALFGWLVDFIRDHAKGALRAACVAGCVDGGVMFGILGCPELGPLAAGCVEKTAGVTAGCVAGCLR